MSDTPETDLKAFWLADEWLYGAKRELVDAATARDLERRLRECQKNLTRHLLGYERGNEDVK